MECERPKQADLALVERLLAATLPYAHRVVNVYLFGSRAHGLATLESDYDVMAVIESTDGSDDKPGSRLLDFESHNLSITVFHLTFFCSLVQENVVWVSTVPFVISLFFILFLQTPNIKY
jgi:predicted nucleotidyltransferase